MSEATRGSIFELSGVGVPTICQWSLVWIIGSCKKTSVTVKGIADCVRKLMKEVTYKRDKSFLFWLGPAVTIEEVLDEMVCLDILEVQHSVKSYRITERGEEALKSWIPRIVTTLHLEDDEELGDVISQCTVSH